MEGGREGIDEGNMKKEEIGRKIEGAAQLEKKQEN